jgi:hypothetical protein
MSAAAQEALAKPAGLNDCAAPAASPRWGYRRVGARLDRGGCDVGCACCQWSSGHPRRATLVRHFMCGAGVVVARDVDAGALSGPQCSALAPALRSRGVPHAPTARALVATGDLAPGKVVRLAPAGAAAIPVAEIAAAAQDDLNAAPGAQEQTGWTVQRHHQTEPVVLDGVVPAGHTAVAPPSSARCRARRSHQAARRERAAAAPTFFGSGRVVLRRLGPRWTAFAPRRTPAAMPITPVISMTSRRPCPSDLPGRPAGRPGRHTSHRSDAQLATPRAAAAWTLKTESASSPSHSSGS